jgi:hypothetical protein
MRCIISIAIAYIISSTAGHTVTPRRGGNGKRSYWISRASAIHQYARNGCERARFFGMVTVIYKYQRHMPLAKELESWHVMMLMMLACNGRTVSTTTNA